jgi:hypothetical protein
VRAGSSFVLVLSNITHLFSSLYSNRAGMRKRLAELGFMADMQDTRNAKLLAIYSVSRSSGLANASVLTNLFFCQLICPCLRLSSYLNGKSGADVRLAQNSGACNADCGEWWWTSVRHARGFTPVPTDC